MKEPANMEEAADDFLILAEKLGFSVTKESILSFLNRKEKDLKENAAKAESAVKEALGEEALETVAGGEGANPGCASSFSPGEFCWVSDFCSYLINGYTGADLNNVNPNSSANCANEVFSMNAVQCENATTQPLEDDFWFVEQACVGNPENCESAALEI